MKKKETQRQKLNRLDKMQKDAYEAGMKMTNQHLVDDKLVVFNILVRSGEFDRNILIKIGLELGLEEYIKL